jgi:hypothetical protein
VNTDIMRAKARAAYKDADWLAVLSAADELIDRDPSDVEAAQLKARALTNLREWQPARLAWAMVRSHKPDNLDATYQFGRASARSGHWFDSLAVLDELLDQADADAASGLFAFRLAMEVGAYPAAVRAVGIIERAGEPGADLPAEVRAAKDPRVVAVAAAAAQSDAAADDVQACYEDLMRRAVGREHADALLDAYRDFAAAALLKAPDSLASRSCDRVFRAQMQLADQALSAGDLAEAESAFFVAIQCRAADTDALQGLGRTLMRAQRWGQAVSVWQALLKVEGPSEEVSVQLARSLERSGRYVEGHEAWTRVATLFPDLEEAPRSLERLVSRALKDARESSSAGRWLEAMSWLGQAKALAPDNPDVQRRWDQAGREITKELRADYKEGAYDRVAKTAYAIRGQWDAITASLPLVGKAALRVKQYDMAADALSLYFQQSQEPDPSLRIYLLRAGVRAGRASTAQGALALFSADELEQPDVKQLVEGLDELLTKMG